MALTLQGSPDTLTPAYNPSIWYYSSTNYTQPGFRYYCIITDTATTTTLATYEIVPSPTPTGGSQLPVGYCELNLTKLLQNFVSSDYISTGVQLTPNSWYGYKVNVYEKYAAQYAFTTANLYGTNQTAIYNAGVSFPFIVGDQIVINQTSGAINPALQGIHTVVAPTDPVADPHNVYIDVPWTDLNAGTGVTTIAVGGSMIFSDYRSITTNPIGFSSAHYIFNGALPFLDWPGYGSGNYKMTAPSTRTKFLTSMPRSTFKVYTTQDARLNFANYFTPTSKTIIFTNDGGDVFSMTTATNVAGQAVIGANVGPTASPSLVSGTSPLIKPTTKYYTVAVYDNAGHRLSEEITYNIDRRCRIQEFEVLFMDRWGSFNSYSFELRGDLVHKNERTTYKKLAGGYRAIGGGHGYMYDPQDAGEVTTNVNHIETLTLNTNWMNDDMSVYFQELVTSPFTYLKVDTNTYIAVTVTNPQMVEKRAVDKKLIRYTIEVRYANPDMINI